jgi:magnesium-transporting ATPase (P-type)
LPIIWFGIYDKENSFSKLEKGKHHYINGIIGKSFHSKRFWKWVVYGIFQGMIICYLSYYSNQFALNKQGGLNDLWSVGKI